MAEKVVEKLEEQLNCSVCLDTYTNPKLLQCFHVYCQHCLVRLVVRDREGRLGITCPNCRQVTPVPDRGVAGLKPAFHINRLLEILEKPENPAINLKKAAPVSANLGKASHCFVHKGKEFELYCETCGELICWKCALKGGKHHDHDYEELDQAFSEYKEEITPWLEPMEEQVATIKQALAQIDACSEEISDQRATTADNIHVTFGKLREVLNIRETELIGQLDQMTQVKLKNLAAQRDQIETTLAQLSSCLHLRETLRTGNEGNVLMMKANTVRQIKELAAPFQHDVLKLNLKANICFTASADFIAACRDYGQIFTDFDTKSAQDASVSPPTVKKMKDLQLQLDGLMKRMDELQFTRVTMEGELCQLREERAAILQENAALREGSLPQNYTNLKTKYEGILNVLRETEVALNEEKKLTSELQSVNLELHQKLVLATDPEKLKSISERMVRYKNERDIAKSELEGAQSRLVAAEIDAKSAQGFSSNLTVKKMEELQLQLDIKETEVEKLTVENQGLYSRMLGYRLRGEEQIQGRCKSHEATGEAVKGGIKPKHPKAGRGRAIRGRCGGLG